MSYDPHPDDLCHNCGLRRGSHMNPGQGRRPCPTGERTFYPSGKRAGDVLPLKGLFEQKNAERVLIQGNVFENNTIEGSVTFAVAGTPRSVGAPPALGAPYRMSPVVVTTAERAAIQVAAEYWTPDISGAAGRLEHDAVRKTLRGLLERLDQ